MKNQNLQAVRWTALLALFAAFHPTALTAASEDQIERSFAVKPGGTLIIWADRGSIDVQSSADDKLSVVVERRVRRATDERAAEILRNHQVNFDQRGDTVTVNARGDEKIWRLWKSPSLEVRFVVLAPKVFNLDLKSSGGGISIKESNGRVTAKTSGGSIHLGQIDGPVLANTSGGSIHLERGHGNIELSTSGGGISFGAGEGSLRAKSSGGSIRVSNFNGEAVVRTSGGGIHAEKVRGTLSGHTSGGSISASFLEAPRGPCELQTSGGGISVSVPEKAALDLDAEATGGSVRSDLPVLVRGNQGRHALRGPINGGGAPFILKTSGGSIQLNKL